jgi:hypothetical protein
MKAMAISNHRIKLLLKIGIRAEKSKINQQGGQTSLIVRAPKTLK